MNGNWTAMMNLYERWVMKHKRKQEQRRRKDMEQYEKLRGEVAKGYAADPTGYMVDFCTRKSCLDSDDRASSRLSMIFLVIGALGFFALTEHYLVMWIGSFADKAAFTDGALHVALFCFCFFAVMVFVVDNSFCKARNRIRRRLYLEELVLMELQRQASVKINSEEARL